MVTKLSVDGGLLREGAPLPAIEMLQYWEKEGRLELFEVDRAKEKPETVATVSPRVSQSFSHFRRPRKMESGTISFRQLSAVIFPTRDPFRLNMTEVNHVAHLLHHHTVGHSIFITVDAKTFIAGGKRERLDAAFKILILTPEEAVQRLGQRDGFVREKIDSGTRHE